MRFEDKLDEITKNLKMDGYASDTNEVSPLDIDQEE